MGPSNSLFVLVMQFVGIFMLMTGFALWLRTKKVLTQDHAPVISQIITDLVIPAFTFYRISNASLEPYQLKEAIAVIGSEVIIGITAWLIGQFLLKLQRHSLGAFILAATFGSTNMIGGALLQFIFPGNPEVLASGVIVSLGGVGIPIGTIGVLIALYFGRTGENTSIKKTLRAVLLNPTILAFMVGIAWNFYSLPVSGTFLTILFGALKLTSISLTFLVALLTGLTIQPMTRKDIGLTLFCSSVLLLVAEPVLAHAFDRYMGDSSLSNKVVLLLAAMPASPLAVAFSMRYGCDVELASKLVVGTCVLSAITLPILVYVYV